MGNNSSEGIPVFKVCEHHGRLFCDLFEFCNVVREPIST